MSRGRLIALEGGEGTGKSTQARLLAERLGAVLTREPGGTELGERIRALVLDPGHHVEARAEALLMAAARAQHVADVIAPALDAGRDVVTDRFTGSSLAYQGVARGLGVLEVEELSSFATAGLAPDATVLLDLDPAVAHARIERTRDRLEREPAAFHDQVAAAFRSLSHRPGWVVVDAGGTVEEVAAAVWAALAPLLPPAA